jgi:hypothetical protein
LDRRLCEPQRMQGQSHPYWDLYSCLQSFSSQLRHQAVVVSLWITKFKNACELYQYKQGSQFI